MEPFSLEDNGISLKHSRKRLNQPNLWAKGAFRKEGKIHFSD